MFKKIDKNIVLKSDRNLLFSTLYFLPKKSKNREIWVVAQKYLLVVSEYHCMKKKHIILQRR